jgi:hypothetical protein
VSRLFYLGYVFSADLGQTVEGLAVFGSAGYPTLSLHLLQQRIDRSRAGLLSGKRLHLLHYVIAGSLALRHDVKHQHLQDTCRHYIYIDISMAIHIRFGHIFALRMF